MKIFKIITFMVTIGIVQSCNNEEQSKTETPLNDSIAQHSNEKTNLTEKTTDQSEINNFSQYPLDTIRIHYRNVRDTIYGYRIKDTLTFEGDIMICFEPGVKGVGTTHRLWPRIGGNTIIPYRIHPNYPFPDSVRKALKMWADPTGIQFVERTFQDDYLEFVPSEFTRSFVGKTRFRQPIELAAWAKSGNIAHEIGHALGLYHEQSRSDRDKYVRVNCQTDPNYRHAYVSDPYARDISTYNYRSIMHYGRSNCLEILTDTLPPGIPGQRSFISHSDIAAIKTLYRLQ